MGSLFLKLFLWLWLTMVLIGGAFLVTRQHWAPAEALPSRAALAEIATELQRLENEDGPGAVLGYLRSLNHRSDNRYLLLGEHRLAPMGRGPAARLHRPLLEAEADSGRVDDLHFRRLELTLGEEDQPAQLVAVRPLTGLDGLPKWLRLAIALTITAGVAAALAAHLSRPVRRVRQASRALAAGDLRARVPAPQRGGDEITALGRDFNTMAARLQTLVEARNQLLRDISHELRSPLARLQVALELARREASGDSAPLTRMERDIERMDGLIGQLLTLARLETGASEPRLQSIDLAQLATEVAEDAAFEAQEHDQQVAIAAGPAPLPIHGDPPLLRSALENVVRNALRHTPAGGHIQIAWHKAADGVSLQVHDSGPGVPEARLKQLFEPFVRLSQAREHGSGHHGLGLAITRRAVELHGGSVSARNHPQSGLEVTLWLPHASTRPPTAHTSSP